LSSPVPVDRQAAREGLSSFIVVFSVAAAIALAALAMLSREAGEPAILLLLAGLAATGIFFLFAVSAGFFRLDIARPVAPVLAACTDQLADGVQIRSADGRPIYANQAFGRLLGLPLDDGSRSLEDVLAETPGAAEPLFRLMRAAERAYEWEESVVLPARETGAAETALRISVSHVQVPSAGRHVVWRLTEASHEAPAPIAAHPAGDDALAAFDDLPAGAFTLQRGEIVHINAVLADWAGLGRDDALPRGVGLAAIGLEPRPERAAQPTRGLRHGDSTGVPYELTRRDGSKIAVRVIDRPITGREEVVIGLVVPEICDRSSAAAVANVESEPVEKLFARFFHAAPIAIAIVERDGAITSANAASGRMFLGLSEQMHGGNIVDLVKEENRSAVREALDALFDGGEAMLPVEIGFGADGARTGRLYLSPLGNRAGDRDAAVLYAIDTTKERELELQFAQSQKMQAVGQLAGGIAHDFNNVLTVIIGFSDLLLANHRPTDPAFRDIVAIKQNANRAASLVRQLLAFSRRQTLRPEVLSLSDVISDLSIFLSRILGERVKLKVTHGRDLWEVKADVTQFEQVIVNLAVNARDAMPDGGKLTIRTSNLLAAEAARLKNDEVEPGDYVVCEVTDTGTGMTREVMAKMFEPFFSTKEVGKGTGLGLSTVYGFVKQTGGAIFCDSVVGKGTTFRIYLPRHREQAGMPAIAKAEKKERSKDLTGTGTVLLVEDEEAVRRFAARALTRQGYRVLEAGSGAEALDVIAGHAGTIDLVLSDVVMPEMDGPTLLKELRKQYPDLRIVFISGYAEDALKTLSANEEFSFLPKPFQLKDLVAAVKDAIER
jgi:two-component system cell cycle sensor histidine kinase/response regulator CckA